MNKRFYYGLLTIVLSFTVLGCNDVNIEEVDLPKCVVMHATIAGNETVSRTAILNNGEVFWSLSEVIDVYTLSDLPNGAEPFHFVSTNSSPSGSADFEGEITINESETYFALYPGDGMCSSEQLYGSYWGDLLTHEMPPSVLQGYLNPDQTVDYELEMDETPINSSGNAMMATYSVGSVDNMFFQNICSGLKFSVSESGITKVSLKGNDGEKLAGTFSLDFLLDDEGVDRPVATPNETEAEEEVLLSCPGGFIVGDWFYLLILPRVFEKGITITISYSDGKEKALVIDNPLTFKRNVWKRVADIDEKASIVEDEWQYSIEEAIADITVSGSSVTNVSESSIEVAVNKSNGTVSERAPWKAYFSYTEPSVGETCSSSWSETPLPDENSQNWLSLSAYSGDGDANAITVTLAGASGGSISMGSAAASMTTQMSNNNLGTVDLSKMKLDQSSGCFKYSASNSATTANCYVINGYGTFLIPTVYGNGIQNGTLASSYIGVNEGVNPLPVFINADGNEITSDYILNDANLNKSGSYKARIVWQDVRGGFEIIQDEDVEFCESAPPGAALNCPYIRFSISPYDASTGKGIKPGNVVIALYDEGENKILWSWHIWVTNEIFSTVDVNYNETEYESHLNCNLGWTPPISYNGGKTIAREQYVIIVCTITNTVMDAFKVSQSSYSLSGVTCEAYSNTFYQFGRKDPMLPSRGKTYYNRPHTSSYYKISGSTEQYLNTSYTPITTGKDEKTNKLGWMIQNPYIFFLHSNSMPRYYNLWNPDKVKELNDTEPVDVKKSVYDPSPVGFRLPRKDAYEGFGGVNYSQWQSSSGEYPSGWILSSSYQGGEGEMFFPSCGYHDYGNSGRLGNVSARGYYVTAYATLSDARCILLYFDTTSATGHYNYYQALGYTVRPVME